MNFISRVLKKNEHHEKHEIAITINKKYDDDSIIQCETAIFTDLKIAIHYLPWFAEKNVILILNSCTDSKKLELLVRHMHKGKIISDLQVVKDILEKYNIEAGEDFDKKSHPFKLKLRMDIVASGFIYMLSDFNFNMNSLVIEGGYIDQKNFTIHPNKGAQLKDIRVFYRGYEAKYIGLNDEGTDLYNVDDVYIFINEPSKGGIISWIKNHILHLRLSSRQYNIFLVYETAEQLLDDQKYDCNELDCDGIYTLEQLNVENFKGKLLLFTQLWIASVCKSLFKDNNVIIQYHRNINMISENNITTLKTLSKLIECGYIELLEPQENIDELFSNDKIFREFKNYIPRSNYCIKENVVSEIKKVAYVGRLTDSDNAKNMEGLKRIINSCDDITFFIYGSGNAEDDFKKIKNVQFKGYEYNKDLIYSDIDLLILPSIQEAFPLVILEAASYGVKSLTYNNSSMVQKHITNEMGTVIELNNEEKFIDCLKNYNEYDKNEVQKYFDENFAIENLPQLSNLVLKRNVTPFKARGFVYMEKTDKNYIELRIFILGYIKLVGEIMINSTFDYEVKHNKDYEYYSNKSMYYPENFITITIKKTEIKTYDFLEIICMGQKLSFTLVRNAARSFEIDDVYTLNVESTCFEIVETDCKDFKDIVRKYKPREFTYLFQDRIFKGDDNAEHLYKYFMKLGYTNIYYTIDEGSPDFYRLLSEGFKLIKPDSKIHYLLLLKSEAILSSHLKKDILFQSLSNELLFQRTSKVVFLQHGVIFSKSDYKFFLNSLVNPCDLMVVSNKLELKLVEEISNYDNIKITGLARYDNLYYNKDILSNRILYFPTWNRNLNSEIFMQTAYYKGIMSLLEHEGLNKILLENNLILDLVLHPEIEKYSSDFVINSENINKISNTNILFSELVLSHMCLITDVSSLRFDFLFQEKPVISYVPYDVHSQNDIQDVERIVYDASTPSEVCMILNNLKKSNFTLDSDKQQLVDNFITRDGDNCKRIFEEIMLLRTQ